MCFFIARLKIEEEEEEDSLLEKLSLTTFADLAANRFAALLNMSFIITTRYCASTRASTSSRFFLNKQRARRIMENTAQKKTTIVALFRFENRSMIDDRFFFSFFFRCFL